MEIEQNLKTYFENRINTMEHEVDVEQAVMSKISAGSSRHYHKGILSICVILALCSLSTGVAYGKEIISFFENMDFMNNKGEVEWSVSTDKEDYGNYQDAAEEVFDGLELQEGEAVAIYVPENNPDNIVITRQKPVVIEDIDLVNSFCIGMLQADVAKEILHKYEFSHSSVTYEVSEQPDIEKMREEAYKTGKSAVVNNLAVTDNITAISSEYYDSSEGDTEPDFSVIMTAWYDNEVIFTNGEGNAIQEYDKIMLSDSEVLYRNEEGIQSILWLSDGCYFKVSSERESMTKEELLQIAGEIKNPF